MAKLQGRLKHAGLQVVVLLGYMVLAVYLFVPWFVGIYHIADYLMHRSW